MNPIDITESEVTYEHVSRTITVTAATHIARFRGQSPRNLSLFQAQRQME